MQRLGSRWPVLVATWLGLGIAIFLITPHYNDAQRAGDADTFRAVVDADGPGRFAVAAVIDVAFAVAYGLLGVVVGWREVRGEGAGWRRIRRAAGASVVVGALCDVAENVLVLANVVRRDTLTDGWVDAMRTLGDLKWLLGLGGAAVLLLAHGVAAARRR